MKRIKILLVAVLTIIAATACSQSKPKDNMEKKNILVVFSLPQAPLSMRLRSWHGLQGQTSVR